MSNLEPEIRSRSRAGSTGNWPTRLCRVDGLLRGVRGGVRSTPYYADHPIALVLVGCLTLFVGALRILAARQVLSHPDSEPSRNASVFKGPPTRPLWCGECSARGRSTGMPASGRPCCFCFAPRRWRAGHRLRWPRTSTLRSAV